jgi:hypothetical protein
MTPINQRLEILAKQLNLISHNEETEEYILTDKEVDDVVSYTLNNAKKFYRTKHLAMGESGIDIDIKIGEINWHSEANIDAALKTANSNKHYEIWLKNKKEQEHLAELVRLKELKERHTAKFFYNVMAWTSKHIYGKNLILNEHNKHLITTICFFLSNDERFETELGYSFDKGLLVRGISGLGKTFLFNCVKDNELSPITIYSMIELTETVRAEGYLELPLTTGITYLDDVGTEEHNVNHYGTKINFFKNFIEKYYLNNAVYNRLIISTNNSFTELETKYGFRVRSRVKDMFNIINVTGTDMRG